MTAEQPTDHNPGSLPGLVGHVSRHTCATLFNAPEAVGVYAWYGVLGAGPKDYEIEIVNGEDAGISRFRTVLQRHTQRFTSAPIELHATTNFASKWAGYLQDGAANDIQNALDPNESDASDSGSATDGESLLQRVMFDPAQRKLLAHALGAMTPFFTAPVYVGVATNLRERLSQHRDGMNRALNAVQRDPSSRDRLLREGRKFAHRAVGLGFTPETLEVWTLNLESLLGNSDTPHLRRLAEAAEWFVNRWHRPPLGRK